MAEEPDDLVLQILRDIQATLEDHTRKFEGIGQRFDRLERRFDEVHGGMITALGLAGHAHVLQECFPIE